MTFEIVVQTTSFPTTLIDSNSRISSKTKARMLKNQSFGNILFWRIRMTEACGRPDGSSV